jgi:uncharacterized protein YjiS (DUF1127 family)
MPKALANQAVTAIGGSCRIGATIAGVVIRMIEWLVSWNRSIRDRRLLARCDERMLRDIGIDAGAVDNESTLSFWRGR